MVLSRHINSEGCLVTKRLHVIYQDVPAFIAALGGNIVTYAGEESVVDPKNKTMTLRTKNLSLTSVASVDEFCTYCQSKEDPSKTAYSKRLEINGFLPGFLNSQIEGYFVYADAQNRGNGIRVMDDIIKGVSQLLLPLAQRDLE